MSQLALSYLSIFRPAPLTPSGVFSKFIRQRGCRGAHQTLTRVWNILHTLMLKFLWAIPLALLTVSKGGGAYTTLFFFQNRLFQTCCRPSEFSRRDLLAT